MKTFKTILTFIFIGYVNMTYAQVELEKAYNFKDICPTCTTKVRAFNTDSKTFYYIVAKNSINIYNQDHSLYKKVQSKNTNDQFCEIYLPSDKLFNSDNSIEFIALKSNNYKYSFVVMTENGDSIASVGAKDCDGYQYYNEYTLIQYFKTIDNKSKIIVNSPESFCDSVFVYGLSGTLSQTQINLLKAQSLNVFPNPASNYITIKTDNVSVDRDLKIFDINGSNISTIKINSNTNEKTIDISNFKSGVYIYKINDKSGKFIVE